MAVCLVRAEMAARAQSSFHSVASAWGAVMAKPKETMPGVR